MFFVFPWNSFRTGFEKRPIKVREPMAMYAPDQRFLVARASGVVA